MSDSTVMPTQTALSRVQFALPDAIVSGLFLAVWINPHLFSVPFIAGVMGTLGVEATLAFVGVILFILSKADLGKAKFALLVALPLFIALSFVSGIATAAHSLWIYLSFVWLVGTRILGSFRVGTNAREIADEAFAASVLSGIGLMLCSVTLVLPSPPLGYNAAAIKSMGLPVFSSAQPHAVLQFGFVFYAVRTALKLRFRLRRGAAAEAKQEKLIRF